MKMKTIKKFPRFTIIYLHDSFRCIDCIKSEHLSDVFTDGKLEIALKKRQKKQISTKRIKSQTSTHKNSIHKTSVQNPSSVLCKKLCFQDKNSSKFAFKKHFKLTKNRTRIPFKKAKNQSCKSCASSVIKTRKKTEVRKTAKKQSTKKQSKYRKKISVDDRKTNSSEGKPKLKPDASDDIKKPPGKGTLKRKRWFFDKLNTSNDNYEDDIFENEKFNHFKDLIDDDTDSMEKYEDLQTPVFPFSISPRQESPSPTYKDCYSPTELTESRKGAEEYRFRRGKMKKGLYTVKRNIKKPEPENKPDVQKTLEAVVEILNKTQKMLEKSESDSEEDSYFPDLFNPSSVQSCN